MTTNIMAMPKRPDRCKVKGKLFFNKAFLSSEGDRNNKLGLLHGEVWFISNQPQRHGLLQQHVLIF